MDNKAWVAHSKPWLQAGDEAAVAAILRTGNIAAGTVSEAFSHALLERYGFAGGFTCASGSAALLLGLLAMGIGKGDEVILPTYVCHNVADAVVAAGATPVLCDASADYVSDAQAVRACITARTKAVVAVHIFGIVADVAAIAALGVPVIEDWAQYMPVAGSQANRSVFAFFSFHPTKCLTAGRGGMFATNDLLLLQRAEHIARKQLLHDPLSDLEATLALRQLATYDEMLTRRKALAMAYLAALPPQTTDVMRRNADRSMFYRFALLSDGWVFDDMRAAFAQYGVHVRRGVDALLHDRYGEARDFPIAESLFKGTVSIPLYPALTEEEAARVIDAAGHIL